MTHFKEQKKEAALNNALQNTIHFPRMELLDSTEHTTS